MPVPSANRIAYPRTKKADRAIDSLAIQPGVALRGEITLALDRQLVGKALKMVESLAAKGMTLLVVTHEMNFARKVADRVVFMHAGRLHEMGPPPQLFAAPKTAELQQIMSALHGATRPRFLRWLNERGLHFVQHRG